VGLIGDEAESCGEACVTTLDNINEEFSVEVGGAQINVEETDIKIESIDIKEEIQNQ
jgi:hypothetical protein